MPYVCTLSEELQDKAKKELNEDSETREECIQHIRNWIQEQPHLSVRTDDFFILRFLRGCKFSLEKTKERLDKYFTLRAQQPHFFKNRDPQDPKLREILKFGSMLPLKETDKNGTTVFLLRLNTYNPRNYDVKDIGKAMFLLFDVFFEVDEINQINGVSFIIDAEGLGFHHIMHYNPLVMKDGLESWQEGYAAENFYWTFINQGRIFQIIFNILKVFLREDFKKKITMYGSDYEEIYETVPHRILPHEYGGEGGTLQELRDYWLDVIDSKRDWILEEQKDTVDESKRPKH